MQRIFVSLKIIWQKKKKKKEGKPSGNNSSKLFQLRLIVFVFIQFPFCFSLVFNLKGAIQTCLSLEKIQLDEQIFMNEISSLTLINGCINCTPFGWYGSYALTFGSYENRWVPTQSNVLTYEISSFFNCCKKIN